MKSQKETDIFGNEKIVHYDDDGIKIGETCEETDFFGSKRIVHYDRDGIKIGESMKSTDIFGGESVTHYNRDGSYAGKTYETTDFFGNRSAVHTDRDGQEIGKSTAERDFWGNSYTKTENTAPRAENRAPVSSGYSPAVYSSESAGGGALLTIFSIPLFLLMLAPIVGLLYLKQHGAESVQIIRSVVCAGLCPVVTAICMIAFRRKRTDTPPQRKLKTKMIIATSVLFLVLEACFALYTDPSAGEEANDSFLLFVLIWLPKLAYAITAGCFARKSGDKMAKDSCAAIYRFASLTFGGITAVMELTNIIGSNMDNGNLLLLFLPAMGILFGVIAFLHWLTGWIYRKIAK